MIISIAKIRYFLLHASNNYSQVYFQKIEHFLSRAVMYNEGRGFWSTTSPEPKNTDYNDLNTVNNIL